MKVFVFYDYEVNKIFEFTFGYDPTSNMHMGINMHIGISYEFIPWILLGEL